MAKGQKQEKSMEAALWESANKLRGAVEPAEYKHVVLSLIFLKYASDKFEERRQEIIDEGHEAFVDNVAFYTMKSVFYLPPESRWSYIMEQSKQSDIALKIDTALYTIEKNNESLRGALPDNYYSRLGLDTSKLSSLLDEINKIEMAKDKEQDIMGRVYEYFLSNFALQEGKGKGEFYTPKCIVNLIAELIEPYKGKIYDPCCGSGGMFVQSMKFVQAHNGNTREIAVFGQEATNTTLKLARMNLAIRGINGNLGKKAVSTFTDDQHKDEERDKIHFYLAIRSVLRKLTKGDAPDTAQMNARVARMVEEAIQAEGVTEIFTIEKETERLEQDIFSDEYLERINRIPMVNTKIKILQRLLKNAIDDYRKINKIKGVDFTERMNAVVDLYNARRKDKAFANEVLDDVAEQLTKLLEELGKDKHSFEELNITFEEKAFFDILEALAKKYGFYDEYIKNYGEEHLLNLAKDIKTIVDDKAKYAAWSAREDIKAELKVNIILKLAEYKYPPVTQDEVYKEVLEQAENFRKYID